MKSMSWLGILMIVVGALALAYQGFTYTHQEKVLDVGPIHSAFDQPDGVVRTSEPGIVRQRHPSQHHQRIEQLVDRGFTELRKR